MEIISKSYLSLSHAAAYAVISYRSAYLKAHYTGEYMAALLTSVLGNQAKVSEYISESAKFGISVLPPDINGSRVNFSADNENGNIRFGLLALKNVGKQFIEAIISERETGKFTSFDNFVERMSAMTDLNKRQVEALIKSGAFDGLGLYRSQLLAAYETLIDNIQQKNRNNPAGQIDMFSMGTIEAPTFTYPNLPDYSIKEKLMLEKEASGMYFSGHMLDSYSKHIDDISPISLADITESDEQGEYIYSDKDRVEAVGIISAVSVKTTKKDEQMAFIKLEDKLGQIECLIFPKAYNEFYHMLYIDAAVHIKGTVSLKDEEAPKILVNEIEPLIENAKYNGLPKRQVVRDTQSTVEKKEIAADTSNSQEVNPALSIYLSMYSASAQATPAASQNDNKMATVARATVIAQPQKIYLRVPDMTGDIFKKAKNIVDIFNEGSIRVIFYDGECKKYSEYSERMFYSEYAINELKKLIGEENVVVK